MLVAAVLRPEQREDSQLEVVGLATEQLDDAVQPVVVEIVDRAVTQELTWYVQCGLRIHGRATSVGPGAGRSQRRGGGASILLHGGVQ